MAKSDYAVDPVQLHQVKGKHHPIPYNTHRSYSKKLSQGSISHQKSSCGSDRKERRKIRIDNGKLIDSKSKGLLTDHENSDEFESDFLGSARSTREVRYMLT